MAAALGRLVPPPGVVAHLGGEEFVIMLPDASMPEAERLIHRVIAGVRFAGTSSVTLSVGLTSVAEGQNPAALLSDAQQALVFARRRGANSYALAEGRRGARDRVHAAASPTTDARPNLLRGRDEFCDELSRTGRKCVAWLVYLDVNDLGRINARRGVVAGNLILAELGRRLAQHAGRRRAARMGGDVFLVDLGPGSAEDMTARVRGLLHALSRPITLADAEPAARVIVTAGVARLIPGEDPGEAIHRAHLAFIRARRAGTDQFQIDVE